METIDGDKIISCVTENELQFEAQRIIGRQLTEDEMFYAQKCIGWGLGTGCDIVFRAAIEESLRLAE